MEALEPKRPRQEYTEQQAKEILAQAMNLPDQQGNTFSRVQLAEMAAELGISSEALQLAEQQWLRVQESASHDESRAADMQQYLRERRKDFNQHLQVFVIVHVFLALINILTGGGPWVLYPLLGWGIALALHAWSTFNETRGDDMEEEFEKWRAKRLERLARKATPQLPA